MIISIEFQIPAKTTLINLKTQVFDLGVNAAFLKRGKMLIPDGHRGLAFIRVETPGRQLLPAMGSNIPFVRGNNSEIPFDLNIKIDGPPYNIICRGYNEDEFIPHSFFLDFEV